MSAAVTEVTGATLVRLGVGMRVPVTTISETSLLAAAGAAAAALAWVAERPATAAPHIIDVAKRRVRIVVVLKIKTLHGRRAEPGATDPQRKVSRGYGMARASYGFETTRVNRPSGIERCWESNDKTPTSGNLWIILGMLEFRHSFSRRCAANATLA